MKSEEWRSVPKNLERKKELEKRYYAANPEPYKQRMKDYQVNNPEGFRRRSNKWAMANHAGCLLRSSRDRAKKAGLEFNIDLSDIHIPEFCPILGIPIVRIQGSKTGGSASLDRIDNSRGYVKGNVWVISLKANIMKSNATPDELRKFANWINDFLSK